MFHGLKLGWVGYISEPSEVKHQIVAMDLEYSVVSKHCIEERKTLVFEGFVFGRREM